VGESSLAERFSTWPEEPVLCCSSSWWKGSLTTFLRWWTEWIYAGKEFMGEKRRAYVKLKLN